MEFKVRSKGRNGFVWARAADLPDVVTRAYEIAAREGAMAVVEVDLYSDLGES